MAKGSVEYLDISHLRICWQPSLANWVKVNVDGSLSARMNIVAVGGMIQDVSGGRVVGFSTRVGVSSVFHVEAKALYEGLKLAWDNGFCNVEVEAIMWFLSN